MSRTAAETRSRSWRSSRTALVVALVILVVVAAAGVTAIWLLQRSLAGNIESLGDPFAAIDERPGVAAQVETGTGADDAPMNLLVLGTDSRISAGDPAQWQVGAQRTDTMMLVHVPADRRSIVVVSIPRDSWVQVPGRGQAKINAAFAYGGPSLAIETVELLTDVRIDHFVVTDFESFRTITDALGGVRISLKTDLVVGEEVIPAGNQQLLTGDQALAFVRERADLPRGDFDRVQRQQAWVRAMVAKMRNDGTLGNPISAHRFLQAVTQSVAADDGLDAGVIAQLRELVTEIGSNDILFMTLPNLGTGTSPDGQSIVQVDQREVDELMMSIRDGTVLEHVQSSIGDFDTLPAVVD